jgi:hypothetical protein
MSVKVMHLAVIHELTLTEIHPDAVTTTSKPPAAFLTIARGDSSRD